MNLSCLLESIKELPDYRRLVTCLGEPCGVMVRAVMPDAVKPFIVAALHMELGVPILLVASQTEEAKRLFDELQVWCPSPERLRFFPEIDLLAGEGLVSDILVTAERLGAISALSLWPKVARDGNCCPLVVCSILGVVGKTIPREEFLVCCHRLEVGMNFEPLRLIERWQSMGYELQSIVEVPGAISRRGGIVDVFSPNSELPARIEFDGNRIGSIRLFDPKTQRSLRLVDAVTIVPAREGEEERATGTILDYLPDEALLVIDDLDEVRGTIDKLRSQVEELRQMRVERVGEVQGLPASCLSWQEFEASMGRVGRRLMLQPWNVDSASETGVQCLPVAPVASYGGRLGAFCEDLKKMLERKHRVVIVSQQTSRLAEFLEEQDILAHPVSRIEQLPPRGSVTLVQGSLAEGWAMKDVVMLFTDKELFGVVKQRRWVKKRPIHHHWLVAQLTPGDYVVHIEHGIARFAGVTRMPSDGVEREYLVLEYAAGDRLYVPVDQVDRVSRYIGAGDQPPTLNRLGTQEWARTKRRIKESVANIARELLDIYAAREVIPGFAFSPDTLWQQELESSFPYVETVDQLEAVRDVKSDMEKPSPMDRLVCGDVGYGKTEVALRAAFKAVMAGKQVAVLVPTTVLAQQHFVTFRERLQPFPVRIEMLSRFCTEKEQAEVIEGLAVGTVDICIGTHRLLQKDVKFKDLGLVIIDEEQRFGVIHKEYFKKLRREVDVLTLSATPIPRTLHMSLAGIRNMSTIETPPEERLPIKTYAGPYDERIVREAILRELERNGQVFFVHNRVHSIARVAAELGRLVPEGRISVAHGQMPEDELERVMADFVAHKSDILVTTTIIESGLDMPNVNTLIVEQADRLGLTQLYQLRGRVGRGSNNAYAYFFFDRGKQLTPEARKRLRTICEATELGAGFAIAMKDLEIRGAGNLLGVEQSGYIAAVGFDLYCRLLAEAVEELKREQKGEPSKRVPEPVTPAVALPVSAYIPEEYIPVLSTRLSFYQRLAGAQKPEEVKDIALELNDRFGPMPLPVKNLLYVVEIRQLAASAMIESISTEDRQVVLHFADGGWLSLLSSVRDSEPGVKIGRRQIRLDLRCLGDSWQQVLKRLLQKAVANT